MFKKYKLLLLLILVNAMLIMSCTKQLDTNLSNPNGVSISTLSGKDIFAQALLATVTMKVGADFYDYAAQWMQYYARNIGWAQSGAQFQMETFTLNNSFANPIWAGLYHNIYDYNFIIAHSTANSILPGAAKVMRVMVMQDLVDQFGNVPYSQAAQPEASITPAYDSAEAIYKDLIIQLDSAISSISASQSTADDASDIMFNGNKSIWLQFANTIKLRILLRQVPNTGNTAYVTTELGKIISQGNGFLSVGQDASINPGFADASFQQSPFWGVYGFQPNHTAPYQNYNFFCANSYMVALLDSINDPRLGYFYGLNSENGYSGEPFGSNPNPITSPFGHGLLQSPQMPALLVSASQSLFMQAEAIQRGLMSGNYAALYQQAVEESFRFLTIPNYVSAADNYIANSTNPNVNISISGNPLQTILYQKWISECGMDGLEAWNDYKRTRIPNISNASASAPGSPIPNRLLYPQSEYSQNPANVNKQNQASQGQAAMNIPIFWQQ